MVENLFQTIQQLQSHMTKYKQQLENHRVEGSSGAGSVRVVMNGTHDILKVQIDPDMMSDREVLEDLVAAAVNDANRRVERLSGEVLQEHNKSILDFFK